MIQIQGRLLFADAAAMTAALALVPGRITADQCRLYRTDNEVLIAADLAGADAPVLEVFREIAGRAQWSSLRIVVEKAVEPIPAGRTPVERDLGQVIQRALFDNVFTALMPAHRARDALVIAELSDNLMGPPIYKARLCRLLIGRPHVQRTPAAQRLFAELLARPIADDDRDAADLRAIHAEVAAAIAPKPKPPRKPRSRR